MKRLEDIWPDWQSVELIGQGSYGKVYKIKRTFQQKEIYSALKILDVPQDDSVIRSYIENGMDNLSIISVFQNQIRALENEILIMEKLRSAPNIVSIEDYYIDKSSDSIHSRVFIRMELLKSLSDHIKDKSPDQEEIIKLGTDLCSALSACEKAQIIHRDIKPQNIFVTQYGDYKLGDFGIARQLDSTRSAFSVVGTPAFEAPEVMRETGYNNTADIYSLGLVLYSCLNHGRLPFYPPYPEKIRPSDITKALQMRISGEKFPVPEGCDEDLIAIIETACAPNPERRFQKADAFRKSLIQWRDGNQKPKISDVSVYDKDIRYTCVLDFLEAVSGCEKYVKIPYYMADGIQGIRKIRLKFLPGAASGMTVSIADMGNCMADGTVGTLYVTSFIPSDKRFSRHNNDIIYHYYLDRKEKHRIRKIEVPYQVGRSTTLNLPTHISDGQRFLLKGMGIRQHGTNGNLYVVIHLTGRKSLLSRIREFWKS